MRFKDLNAHPCTSSYVSNTAIINFIIFSQLSDKGKSFVST